MNTEISIRKIIVVGSRSFDNYEKLSAVLSSLIGVDSVEIVCGEAKGADFLGRRYAKEHDLPIKSFPANWTCYGRRAGMIRNEQMGFYANELVVFWGGKSHGTRHMISVGKEHGLKIHIEQI